MTKSSASRPPDAMGEELKRALHQAPPWQKEGTRKVGELNREMAAGVAAQRVGVLVVQKRPALLETTRLRELLRRFGCHLVIVR